RRNGDRPPRPRIASRPRRPLGDDERPEAADGHRSVVAEPVTDPLEEGAERAGRVTLRALGGTRENLDQIRLVHDSRSSAPPCFRREPLRTTPSPPTSRGPRPPRTPPAETASRSPARANPRETP